MELIRPKRGRFAIHHHNLKSPCCQLSELLLVAWHAPSNCIRTILIFPHNALQFKSHHVKHSPSTHLLYSFFAETISRSSERGEAEVGALQRGGQLFAKFIPKLVVTDVKLA